MLQFEDTGITFLLHNHRIHDNILTSLNSRENRMKNKLYEKIKNEETCMIIGHLIVNGIDDTLRDSIRIFNDQHGELHDWMEAILNAKAGFESNAAREALRMALIDLDFAEVENVIL